MRNLLTFLLIFSLSGFFPPLLKYPRIKIELSNFPSEGALAIALFNSADGFPYDFNKAYKVISYPKKMDSIYFEAPHGTYAVSVKWDEFYIRPDTLPMAYNHATLYAFSGNGKADFKSSSFKVRKEEHTVKIDHLNWY